MTLSKYKQMTQKQLREVVACYAVAFPDWKIAADGMAVVRSSGPIQKMIWFQKMNYAAYRPTHVIGTTVLPMPRMLHQLLDARHRETEYSWHEDKWRAILVAMEQQFKPAIRKPLDMGEVLSLCEAEARPSAANDLAMLAILYAWKGRDTEALACCIRMQGSPLPDLAPVPEWEAEMKAFGRTLTSAIDAGSAREFLKEAIENSKPR